MHAIEWNMTLKQLEVEVRLKKKCKCNLQQLSFLRKPFDFVCDYPIIDESLFIFVEDLS